MRGRKASELKASHVVPPAFVELAKAEAAAAVRCGPAGLTALCMAAAAQAPQTRAEEQLQQAPEWACLGVVRRRAPHLRGSPAFRGHAGRQF